MDGYRQSLLGRALADALQELEEGQSQGGADVGATEPKLNGDLLFLLFDEAIKLELRDKVHGKQTQTFTHDLLQLTGRVTAFNRFVDDWSVLARVPSQGIFLDHDVAALRLPHENEGLEVAMRLKLRKQQDVGNQNN